MTDVIFQALAKSFAEQGRAIERIKVRSAILFNVRPYSESFLGWDKATLSHFTVFDCLPLAEVSKEEILSGSDKLKGAICEAIDAMKIEEAHVSKLKKKALSHNQMIWR